MATNPEDSGPQGTNNPSTDTPNPERLAQENQELRAKVGAMEVQMNEMSSILQTLRAGTTIAGTAVVNPGGAVTALSPPGPVGIATILPPPGSAGVAATLPPPEPVVSQFVYTPGVNSQNQLAMQRYPWGMPFGYTPSGAETNPENNSVRVTEQRQPTMVGSGGVASGPQVHFPNPVVIPPRTPLGFTPVAIANPQNQVHNVGNSAQHGEYYYNMGGYHPSHQFENPQPRDRYHLLEERLRAVEGSDARARDAYDLCLVPNVIIPPKFKVPDFDKYRGTSCPYSHLTMYCRKMAAFAHDDKVLIHYFQDSLSGASLNWYMQLQPANIHNWRDLAEAFLRQYKYNNDMAPDRVQLQNMTKRDNESFKEYAQRWRALAAQVAPPLLEKEMVYMFMETLPPLYYDRLIGSVSSSFSDMVVIGERLENGMRSGKIAHSFAGSNNQKKSSSGFPKKKDGETNAISGGGGSSYNHPPQTVPFSAQTQPQQANTGYRSQNYPERKRVSFDPIPMTYTELFKHLIAKNLINPRSMKPLSPPFPRGYNANATCEFHEGGVGHTVEDCKAFKHVVQDLIDANWLSFKQNSPSVATNPLPKHEGPSTNAVEGKAEQVLVRDVRNVRTPLEAIYAELCRSGIIEKDCCHREGCADSQCVGACKTFEMILQDLMDRQVVQIGYVKPEENVMTLQSSGERSRVVREPVQIGYDYNPALAKVQPQPIVVEIRSPDNASSVTNIAGGNGMPRSGRLFTPQPQPIVVEIPGPFPYEKDSAVPWKYSTISSGEASPSALSVTNIAGSSGMTRSGRLFTPEALRGEVSKEAEDRVRKGKAKVTEVTEAGKVTEKEKAVEKETGEFLRIMRQSDYRVVDQLKQTPAKISMLSLLLDSEAHRGALMKILNEAHVDQDISVGQFDGIVGNIVAANYLTFNDEELPPEGREHNQALHISVKCGDYMLSRVLIDNGSSLNVMPKSTMNKLDVDCSYMKPSSTLVRAFDGSKKEVLGEMEFPLQIGPETFYVNFQIMDITSSYSCLLGRPWIHMAGAVPSTLHQRIKFVGNNNVVVVFGEEEMLVNKPSPFRYVKAAEESLDTAFQSLEIANAVFVGGSSPLSAPKLSKNAEMVARVMADQGYKSGCGLGKSNQGIVKPIQPVECRDRCGLGYHPGLADRKRIADEKREQRLAKAMGREPRSNKVQICDLSQTFCSAGWLDPDHIAAVEEGPSDEDGAVNLVRRCPAEEKTKNWETVDFPVMFISE